jgi:hypothetical protein
MKVARAWAVRLDLPQNKRIGRKGRFAGEEIGMPPQGSGGPARYRFTRHLPIRAKTAFGCG